MSGQRRMFVELWGPHTRARLETHKELRTISFPYTDADLVPVLGGEAPPLGAWLDDGGRVLPFVGGVDADKLLKDCVSPWQSYVPVSDLLENNRSDHDPDQKITPSVLTCGSEEIAFRDTLCACIKIEDYAAALNRADVLLDRRYTVVACHYGGMTDEGVKVCAFLPIAIVFPESTTAVLSRAMWSCEAVREVILDRWRRASGAAFEIQTWNTTATS